jgi:tight adherence protein C
MNLTILFGVFLFVAFLLAFLLWLSPSPESVLLEKVTRPAHQPSGEESSGPPRSAFFDLVAKPFTIFRKLFSSEPDPILVRQLLLAGYRKPSNVDMFLGARLAVPAFLGVCVALFIESNTFLFFLLAMVLGYFLPDFWLSHAIKKRREKIRLSLPDGLDLLSICMEAGLGLDQGIVRVGQELRSSHPELSEEFLQVNFEQRAGVRRIAAWKSFSERVDIESVRSFVAMLIQTDRFGTPLAKSLGNFSDELRTQRRQVAEEKAAKTTIKLVPPLVFFIFPSIGIVVIGPAVITLMNNLGHMVG